MWHVAGFLKKYIIIVVFKMFSGWQCVCVPTLNAAKNIGFLMFALFLYPKHCLHCKDAIFCSSAVVILQYNSNVFAVSLENM